MVSRLVIGLAISFGLPSLCFCTRQPYLQGQNYLSLSGSIEQEYLQKLPIYADYIDPAKERLLRTYLLPYHLKAVAKRAVKPIANDQEILPMLKQGLLVDLKDKAEDFYFFYNVAHKYRYLSPHAAKALADLGERFQKVLQDYQVHHQVKFGVSSALRPMNYQRKLGKHNANASLVSGHSYGESFDIFYDEFYVFLADQEKRSPKKVHNKTNKKENESGAANFHANLRHRLGFLLGRSMRRQLRSALTEAILQLQQQERIYAVLEKRQRCYHITPRP